MATDQSPIEVGQFGSMNASNSGVVMRRRSYSKWLSFALIGVVLLSPVPVASNRPEFWMLWAAVLFVALAVHLLSLAWRDEKLNVPLRSIPFAATMAGAFIGFGVLQTLSLGGNAISVAPDATIVATLRWASYAVFFFLTLQLARSRSAARFLGWIAFYVTVVHCAYALISFQYFGEAAYLGPLIGGYADFVTGTFINRNSFATFAGMGFIVGLTLLLRNAVDTTNSSESLTHWLFRHGIERGLYWIMLGVVFIALLASASRMGLIGTMFGSVFVVIAVLRIYRQVSWTMILGLLVALALVLAITLSLVGETIVERLVFLKAESSTRFQLYAQTIELIGQRPLQGHGLDTFEIAFQQVHRPPVSPDLLWDRAHSTYLSLWSEMGLIFGSLPVIIVLSILARIVIKDLRQKKDVVLSIAALGIVVQTGLHSLFDFSLEMPANVFYFLFILALALARGLVRS